MLFTMPAWLWCGGPSPSSACNKTCQVTSVWMQGWNSKALLPSILPFICKMTESTFHTKRKQKQRRDVFFQADYVPLCLTALMVSGANVKSFLWVGGKEGRGWGKITLLNNFFKKTTTQYLVHSRTNRWTCLIAAVTGDGQAKLQWNNWNGHMQCVLAPRNKTTH